MGEKEGVAYVIETSITSDTSILSIYVRPKHCLFSEVLVLLQFSIMASSVHNESLWAHNINVHKFKFLHSSCAARFGIGDAVILQNGNAVCVTVARGYCNFYAHALYENVLGL